VGANVAAGVLAHSDMPPSRAPAKTLDHEPSQSNGRKPGALVQQHRVSIPLIVHVWESIGLHSVKPKARMFDPEASATNCLLSNMYVIGEARKDWLV
jgi:hypothetical protein